MKESLFFLLVFLFLKLLIASGENDLYTSYAVVVDGGSTGSRLFVMKFTFQDGKRNVTPLGGVKLKPGISTFASDPVGVVDYMTPAILEAAEIVPEEYRKDTKVYVKATAGMRLVPTADQNSIWAALVKGLKENPVIPFIINSENFGTIDGYSEGYYAVLASNFIAGRIDGNLVPIEGTEMLGALDMGGSSTQLIYMEKEAQKGRPVQKEDFWLHSWLSYGVETMRVRVLDRIIEKHHLKKLEVEASMTGEANPKSLIIANPCVFAGYDEWREWQGTNYTLRGTGDGAQCVKYVKSVMWDYTDKKDRRCGVDLPEDPKRPYRPGEGRFRAAVARKAKKMFELIQEKLQGKSMENVAEEISEVAVDVSSLEKNVCPLAGIVPPKLSGHFYAMSVYFYAIDCIRHLGSKKIKHWPTPKLDDIEEASLSFCSMHWNHVRDGNHMYTRSRQLQNRCFEGLYIATLLEHGFGIDGSQRMITLALEVEGTEVEWTLGYALAELRRGLPRTTVKV